MIKNGVKTGCVTWSEKAICEFDKLIFEHHTGVGFLELHHLCSFENRSAPIW